MPRLSAAEVVAAQKAHRHYAAVRAMHRVARGDEDIAAWLHNLGRQVRLAGQESKNPQKLAAPEGSTAPNRGAFDGRAASAQSDTERRR